MSDVVAPSPIIRRVPAGLSQFATYVQSTPGTYDVSAQTKLHRNKSVWTLTGIDVTLSGSGDTLEPLLRAIEPDAMHHLHIVADTVRVADVVKLPSVFVRINARVLEFADGAQINTQGTAYTEAETPSKVGERGKMGRFAGPIELFVGEMSINGDGDQTVIVTDGQDGTMGGPGQPGLPGQDDVIGINFESSEGDAIKRAVNTHRQWTSIRDKGIELSKNGAVISVTVTPANGDVRELSFPKPLPHMDGHASEHLPGQAGSGSIGAYVSASPLVAQALVDNHLFSMKPGRNAPARTVEGGAVGQAFAPSDTDKKTPVPTFGLSAKHDSKNLVFVAEPEPPLEDFAIDAKPGATKTGPEADEMMDASIGIQIQQGLCQWLHPMHAEVYGACLSALSKGGFTDQRDAMLGMLEGALAPIRAAYAQALPPVDFDDDASQDAFQTSFDALEGDDIIKQADQDTFPALIKLQHQMSTLRKQAALGLDHYGHPAGWAPNLSFAAEMDLTRGAGEAAVRALYVSQWLTAASDSVEAIIQAHWEAIVEVRNRRQADYKRQSAMNEALATLATKSERLEADIEAMKGRLKVITDELYTQAENRVLWAATVDIVGSLMTIIPYGQPALGMAGKAVKASSTYINGSASGEKALGKVLDQGKALGKKGLSKRSDSFKKQADKLEEKAKTAEGAKYWDKYKSEERKAFDEGQAAEAEESRAAAKVPKARAAQWSAVADNFTEAATDIYKDISVLAAPEDAAKGLLKQLEAKSDDFKAFSKEIEDLNLRKTDVVGQIVGAHIELASIAADIALTHHMEGVFIDALTDATQGRINPTVVGAADQMKDHALEWLTYQRYKLVKAYEALFLEPCPVPRGAEKFGIEWLVDQFEHTVKTLQTNAETAADSRTIWLDSLDALRGYLEDFTTAISQAIVTKLESDGGQSLLPEKTPTSIILELCPAQLAILNEGTKGPWDDDGDGNSDGNSPWPRTITIDLGSNAYFPYDHDKAVIREITVRDCQVSEREDADDAQKGYRSAGIAVHHYGNGILKSDNALYAVRYGNTPLKTLQSNAAQNGLPPTAATWEFSYDEGTKAVTSGGGMGDDASGLVKSLMGALTQDRSRSEAETFLRAMPAWTELMITAEGNAARWANFDKLVLEVHLNAVEAGQTTSGIDLRMDDGTQWPVYVTHADGHEEKLTTPALILGAPGTDVTLRPERFDLKEITTLGDHDPTGEVDGASTWNVPLRRSTIYPLTMAETGRKLPAPMVPMDWQPGPLTLMQAFQAHLITKHDAVWNPHHGLAYAYSYIGADGKETGLSPWTNVGPVKYYATLLTLHPWPEDVEVHDVKLYRRVRPDIHHGPWNAIEEIAAYAMPNGPGEFIRLDTPLAAISPRGTYRFYDANPST